MIELTIKGRIPSKKNEMKRWTTGSGKRIISPSRKFKDWNEEKLWELKMQKPPKVENVSCVEIKIFAPDKRRADLTNKTESIMDLLVDYGVIEDDNWFEVPQINLIFAGVDREKPRAEVIIKSN